MRREVSIRIRERSERNPDGALERSKERSDFGGQVQRASYVSERTIRPLRGGRMGHAND